MGRLNEPVSGGTVLALLFWVAVWISLPLLTSGGIQSPAELIALLLAWQFAVVPFSRLVHELGHALVVARLAKREAHVIVGRGPWAGARVGRVVIRYSLLPARGVSCAAVCRFDPAGIPWRTVAWIALGGPAATLVELILVTIAGLTLWGLGPAVRTLIALSAIWLIVVLLVNLWPRPIKRRDGRAVIGTRDGWLARHAFARDRAGAPPPQRRRDREPTDAPIPAGVQRTGSANRQRALTSVPPPVKGEIT